MKSAKYLPTKNIHLLCQKNLDFSANDSYLILKFVICGFCDFVDLYVELRKLLFSLCLTHLSIPDYIY